VLGKLKAFFAISHTSRPGVCCQFVNKELALASCIFFVRFQVLTAASMKFRVFWDVAPCSHVAYCLHRRGLTTRRHIPVDSELYVFFFIFALAFASMGGQDICMYVCINILILVYQL
jgi:hypothetical protein